MAYLPRRRRRPSGVRRYGDNKTFLDLPAARCASLSTAAAEQQQRSVFFFIINERHQLRPSSGFPAPDSPVSTPTAPSQVVHLDTERWGHPLEHRGIEDLARAVLDLVHVRPIARRVPPRMFVTPLHLESDVVLRGSHTGCVNNGRGEMQTDHVEQPLMPRQGFLHRFVEPKRSALGREETLEQVQSDSDPLAQDREHPKHVLIDRFARAKKFVAPPQVNLQPEEAADGHRPRIAKDRHLGLAPVDVAIRFLHAEEQVLVVRGERVVLEDARGRLEREINGMTPTTLLGDR